jgi:hypothetical protein
MTAEKLKQSLQKGASDLLLIITSLSSIPVNEILKLPLGEGFLNLCSSL